MADTSFFNKTGTPSSDPSQFTVDDHGLLSGLGDDDHLQYHNDTRGDARYYGKSAVDAALAGKAAASHAHVISDTTGLQTALDGKAASSHTHTLADITDAGTAAAANTSDFATAAQGALAETALQSASFATVASTGLYSDLLSVPSTFTPSTHTHVISDTTGLQTALDGKAATVHTHVISDTTGLQTALDGKSDTGHTHTFAALTSKPTTVLGFGITDAYTKTEVDTSLSGKAASSHTHAISDVTSLQTSLDAKSPLVSPTFTGTVVLPSTTSIGTISSTELSYVDGVTSAIQAQLDGKAASSHTHSIANVTGLQTDLDGKASTTHSHAISDVTGLQTALDGKAASSHTHTASAITDFSEAVDDRVNGLLVAGSNVTLTYNDTSNTMTITASGGSGSGDVAGPASAVNNNLAAFDGTTGKLIKDGGVAASSLAPLASPTFTGTVTAPALTFTAGPTLSTGSGSPESIVTAPIGSLYTRTDGTPYATLYVKTSGIGNTGWSAIGPLSGAKWSDT